MVKKGARYWTKKCDQLFSKIVRARGRCEKCGTTEALQCAHIISRKHLQTRHDPQNAVCLCYRCHIHIFHKDPLLFADWLTERFGTDYLNDLRERSHVIGQVNWEERYNSLVELQKGC